MNKKFLCATIVILIAIMLVPFSALAEGTPPAIGGSVDIKAGDVIITFDDVNNVFTISVGGRQPFTLDPA